MGKERGAAGGRVRAKKTKRDVPVSAQELIALEEFLKAPPFAKTAMGVSSIDGYLTALVIGPEAIMPSDYLPWIWDAENGEASPSFESLDEANRYLDVLMRMNNRIAGELMNDDPRLMPLFVLDERWSPKEWAEGFSDAIAFDEDAWDFLASEHEDWLTGVLDAGTVEGKSRVEIARNGLGVAQHIVSIRDYFREGSWREGLDGARDPARSQSPFVRGGPKIGRNDPCPCGSGRKYKKCCGDAGAVVH